MMQPTKQATEQETVSSRGIPWRFFCACYFVCYTATFIQLRFGYVRPRWIEGFLVLEHSVADHQELSHTRRQRDALGFAFSRIRS